MKESVPVPSVWQRVSHALVICSLLYNGCCTRISHPAYRIPYDQKQLLGVWIGFTEQDTAYYSLVLREDHTGVLLADTWGGTIAIHSVKKWSVAENRLRCAIQSTHQNIDPASLHCEISLSVLSGSLRDASGWSEALVFRRESTLGERLTRLREATEKELNLPRQP
jgi:hypothetical protein